MSQQPNIFSCLYKFYKTYYVICQEQLRSMKLFYLHPFREVMIQGYGYFTCNPTAFSVTAYIFFIAQKFCQKASIKQQYIPILFSIYLFSDACWIFIGRMNFPIIYSYLICRKTLKMPLNTSQCKYSLLPLFFQQR